MSNTIPISTRFNPETISPGLINVESGGPGTGDSGVKNPKSNDPESKGYSTVRRALRVLDAVCRSSVPVTPRRIGEQLGIDRLAAYRSLMSLYEHGYIIRTDNDRAFFRSIKLLGLTRDLQESEERHTAVMNALKQVRQNTGHICTYVVLEGDQAVTVKSTGVRDDTPWFCVTGAAVPLASSAAGAAILSRLPRRFAATVLQMRLTALTPFTVTDSIKYLNRLDRFAAAGFAVDDRGVDVSYRNLAIAIPRAHDLMGMPSFRSALSLCVPQAGCTLEDLQAFVPALSAAVATLSDELAGLERPVF